MFALLRQSVVIGILVPPFLWVADDIESSGALSLTIRLFNTSSASLRELEEMKKSANQIFSSVGIELRWISCTPGPRDSAVCPSSGDAPSQTVIFFRLTDVLILPAHENLLHRAILGRANHTAASAFVFYKTACALEQSAPQTVTRGQILGYGLAHEIGHLLLGTDTHSLVGLMKDTYDRDDLYTIGKGHLFFTAAESRVLRKGILALSGRGGIPLMNRELPARVLPQTKVK